MSNPSASPATTPPASSEHDRLAALIALASALRPELHRYCARLMGSVIEGEDVVQDTLVRAFVALQDPAQAGDELPPLRPWLFRIAHNRAMDLLRTRAVRAAEPLEAADQVADAHQSDPAEALMRQQAVNTAVTRFATLPPLQRSSVILKDVLEEPLADIAALLDVSVDAVKGHLARGRARLRALRAQAEEGAGAAGGPPASAMTSPAALASRQAPPPASAAVARYAALFNQRDWEGLRALLADDVRLVQSTHPQRVGAADVGMFFTLYARYGNVRLAPAWLEGREVLAAFEDEAGRAPASAPGYFMWLDWRDGRIAFIRDYRYVRYVAEPAALVLAG